MPAQIEFGRYVLLDKLSVGGMAEIFLAQARGEAGFRKTCVIKRVLPHLAQREGFREMFLDEAHLASRMNHPGIVQIFDLGREGTDFYLAMEYLAGEDCGELLRKAVGERREVPLEVATRIIASAAEALHYAHEMRDDQGRSLGIVHRDISPSNLFVTYQGAVKLLDFGIARAERRLGATHAGFVKGKLAYMAPEQALGGAVDRQADVWSLGVCLFELLSGTRLFVRDNMAATNAAVVSEPIPKLSQLRKAVPPALEDIVQRALERDKAQRYPTADALRAALEHVLADHSFVPTSAQMSAYLKDLFGQERAAEKERRELKGGLSDPTRPAEGGTPLLSNRHRVHSGDLTVPATAEELDALMRPARPRRRRRRWVAWLVGAALAVAGAVAGWAALKPAASPPPPPTAVGPPARVPPAVPAAAPALVTTAAPAPEPEPEPAEPEPEAARAHPSPKRAEPGWLSVAANVKANAWLDGAALGPLPLERIKASAGEHRLRIANPELGLHRNLKVHVRSGETTEESANVELGTLNVTVTPWADVYVDGVRMGQTPMAGKSLAAATHELKLVGPSGEKSMRIEVKPAQTLVVREELP